MSSFSLVIKRPGTKYNGEGSETRIKPGYPQGVIVHRNFRLSTVAACAAFVLAACQDERQEVEAPVRAIKTFTVADVAQGRELKYPGKVQAANTSSLSFPTAGTIAAVNVKAGDRVAKSQVLATLEQSAFETDVHAATAELTKAQTAYEEKDKDYQRKKSLFAKGWVSRAALEQSQAARETAFSDVGYVNAKLNNAKRVLGDTVLRAPFTGVIGTRSAEPFTEISAGQQILVLNAEEALEVSITVPERVVAALNVGMSAKVDVTTLDGPALDGRITEVSPEGSAGNLFPVKVGLEAFPTSLRAGMTAEVTLAIQRADGPAAYLVPITAIAPGDETSKGYVFVFEPQSSTVRRRAIEPKGVRDNLIAVNGVVAGDQVASAGVTFLHDGQPVKLMTWPLR